MPEKRRGVVEVIIKAEDWLEACAAVEMEAEGFPSVPGPS